MSNCLQDAVFQTWSDTITNDFEERVATIPPNLCAPFNAAALKLEAEVFAIYKVVVSIVKGTESMDEVAKYWQGMVLICDHSLTRLSKLNADHPYCGADIFYDRILDLRGKCQRLQEMHS